MAGNRREIGGQSNKRGNRYEDYFAVFRLLECAPQVLDTGAVVRVKEQASCHVDDLVVQGPQLTLYHQLKTGANDTWTARANKLANEFAKQKEDCLRRGETFRLLLVVPKSRRATRLPRKMPQDLQDVARVMHFPWLERPARLADLPLLLPSFDGLRASRFPSLSEHQAIAGAFFLAYAEHLPDAEGYCVLSHVLEMIRTRELCRLRERHDVSDPRWPRVEASLAGVQGLQWWIDRGYFEWCYPPADQGILGPLHSQRFARFLERVSQQPPQSFEEFERLLP